MNRNNKLSLLENLTIPETTKKKKDSKKSEVFSIIEEANAPDWFWGEEISVQDFQKLVDEYSEVIKMQQGLGSRPLPVLYRTAVRRCVRRKAKYISVRQGQTACWLQTDK